MGRGLYDTTGVPKPHPPVRAERANKVVMTAEKEVPQLLGTTCDHERLQHPKDLGRFRQPYEEKMLPRLKQQRPTDLLAVKNADTFPNFEQPKYQATTAATQLPQHYHSSPSHVATQVRSDNNPSVSSRTREQPTQFLVPVASHANSSKQASNTLGADHYFHESTPQSSYHVFRQPQMTSSSTHSNQQQYPTGISLAPSQPGGLRRSKDVPPTTMPQEATEFAERLSRIGVNVNQKSTSLEAREKRLKNSVASKRFRERKKTRVDELEKRVEILTEERDHYRGLYYQLKESRDIKHSISLPSLTLAMS
ncbi:predicted protein [Histoplasma mississippiense (nom. inval.)]|uniref:predicted protein n=1 Tax=Ajellomyces capsulatus (strain NAm1 / WU24) TaxID=2059318 RepID=UPI000157D0C2|nr:predicted protein [Histoplasma mississippiense (nom. inval.)]EDN11260.1 predicted protein [Histoplasma mississippiense (nom. inval.)]